MRAKPALRFTGTCLKRVVGLKMSLLESGKGIMLRRTVQLLCYMYARQMLNLPCTLLLLPSNISLCSRYSLRPKKTHLHDSRRKEKSYYCSPIQITVQQESEKWNKFLLSLTSDVLSGEIWSLLGVAGILLKAAAPGWYACLYVCVCVRELSGCCAAVLLLWLVDTALMSLPRGCTSVDWDVCRTAVLELLSDFSLKQVKSPPLTPTASSSLSLSSLCLSPSSSTCACLSSLLPRAGIF